MWRFLTGLLKGLGWTAAALVALVALVAGTLIAARLSDGPLDGPMIEMLPGGELRSGEWAPDAQADWSFVRDVDTIELQSGGRTRTTWVVALEGEAYIPCSLGIGIPKRWHLTALEDPRAVVRVDGRRYRRSLQRVEDPVLLGRLGEAVLTKYPPLPTRPGSETWFFRLDPPLS